MISRCPPLSYPLYETLMKFMKFMKLMGNRLRFKRAGDMGDSS